ncbi:MAG TPA: SgcJ/EcaC family oxidoreductase [Terriglobia bacterium]|nr:SgcJ/EcaC family oxidoreductase [Terriglobia bacterium]
MSEAKSAFDFRGAIEKEIAMFEKAANTKDVATIANMYAEDATLLPPGSPPVKGRENIRGYWQAFFNAGASNAKLRVIEVGSASDLAYEIGAFVANLPSPQGGTPRTEGKYVVVWRRQPDGSIKMIVDMFSANA